MSHYCYKNFQIKQNMHGIVGATNEILVETFPREEACECRADSSNPSKTRGCGVENTLPKRKSS